MSYRSMVHRAPPWLVAAVVIMLAAASPSVAQDYEGADFCAECHLEIYSEWKVSGHPYKLAEASKAIERPIPLPEGITWDDVSYVIGGYKWKSRYMGLDGYIITTLPDGTDGQNQYNNVTGRWVDYHPGELKPYDCGRCHTTGYSPEGSQGDLPGIVGTWEFGGIQCEECHGPGFDPHGQPEHIDTSSAACGECHIRGDSMTIPASGGFIRHHEQYNELLASPHYALDCVECHNPHKKSELSIVKTCEDCHEYYAEGYAGSVMDVRGVTCVDCHMPFASKSAEALGPYRGDVRTHLFTINPRRNASMFTADGNFVQLDRRGQGYVTIDFACRDCHTDRPRNWVVAKSRNFHQRGWAGPISKARGPKK